MESFPRGAPAGAGTRIAQTLTVTRRMLLALLVLTSTFQTAHLFPFDARSVVAR